MCRKRKDNMAKLGVEAAALERYAVLRQQDLT
jgi:hypothetical protein